MIFSGMRLAFFDQRATAELRGMEEGWWDQLKQEGAVSPNCVTGYLEEC